jgi:asparagine synthase (glutamine-hydrolysing)
MTLIAGIMSRCNHNVPISTCDSLRQQISRNPSDAVDVFEDGRSYFVKLDVGAYGENAFKAEKNGALTLLAGEPLMSLDSEEAWQSRDKDLSLIHDGLERRDWKVLRRSQGVFCVAHYQPATASLSLIADKLGLRPLYYWVDEKYVIFSSALRIIENLAEVARKMDVRAVTEIVGLGYPLSCRTPYTNVFVLKAAEIVEITEKEISRRQYWRWDDIAMSSQTEEQLLQELYRRFEIAVLRRNRTDTTSIAYLSGGLDSRCVVAALHSQNVRVHTFNFARPGTQDQIFGRDFARGIDAIHSEVPKEPGDHVPDYSSLMARVWRASRDREAHPAERPSLVWSGEGGSVALGHVHMNQKIVDLMRAGEIDGAIAEYQRCEYIYVSPKLFRPKLSSELVGVIHKGIREELDTLQCQDPARNFFLFLILNDQRRKLARHFEDIDLHRLEFQLPFFDSAFLALILSIPIEQCLGHKLYVKWLSHFHPSVTSVPWQAYPGHQKCPLPVSEGLAYQWAEEYQTAERATQKMRLRREAADLLSAPDFPNKILSKRNVQLAAWIHASGWRDYEYLLEAAKTYHIYWRKCGGEDS